jgi:hypothetical protein
VWYEHTLQVVAVVQWYRQQVHWIARVLIVYLFCFFVFFINKM